MQSGIPLKYMYCTETLGCVHGPERSMHNTALMVDYIHRMLVRLLRVQMHLLVTVSTTAKPWSVPIANLDNKALEQLLCNVEVTATNQNQMEQNHQI